MRHVDELPRIVGEAFRIARSGRPGPVLIDLPKDVQNADASHLPLHAPLPIDDVEAPKDASLHEALALISLAQRPVIYGGGGIALGDAVQDFRTFVDATQIPTVLTLKAVYYTHLDVYKRQAPECACAGHVAAMGGGF